MTIRHVLLASVSVMVLFSAAQARAQSAISLGSASYTPVHIDNLWFTVSSCTYASSTVASTSCANGLTGDEANDQVQFSLSGNNLTLSVNNSTVAGAPALASIATGADTFADLTMAISVWSDGASSSTSISNVSTSIAGTAPTSAERASISAALSWTSNTSNLIDVNADGPTSASSNFSPIYPATYPDTGAPVFTYDLHITNAAANNVGDTLRLTSVASYYGPAPEPASLSLFGTGVLAVGGVRRLRRGIRPSRN